MNCRICLSPYRDELLRVWNQGFPRKQVYLKYGPMIWAKGITFGSFQQAMHIHKDHKPPNIVVLSEVKRDTQGIAKMLTELYAKKLEGMSPEDVTSKDYYQANKLVIEEQKLSLDKNAQMLEFAKIFGIPEPIQGEIVKDNSFETKEDNAQLGPDKDEGDKPTGS